MNNILIVAQIILSVFITTAILLQAQGSGLGSTWGGGGETYHTRRGLEKVLFYATIGALALFIITSLAVFIF
ncbi:MAG TPA: preprotein translocase subunit SecG [Patescibacteria group bacterium]